MPVTSRKPSVIEEIIANPNLPAFITYKRKSSIKKESELPDLGPIYIQTSDDAIFSARKRKRRLKRRIEHVRQGLKTDNDERVKAFLEMHPLIQKEKGALSHKFSRLAIRADPVVSNEDIKLQIHRAKTLALAKKQLEESRRQEEATRLMDDFVRNPNLNVPVTAPLPSIRQLAPLRKSTILEEDEDESRESLSQSSRVGSSSSNTSINSHDHADGEKRRASEYKPIIVGQPVMRQRRGAIKPDNVRKVSVMGTAIEGLHQSIDHNTTEVHKMVAVQHRDSRGSLQKVISLTTLMKEKTLALERGTDLSIFESKGPVFHREDDPQKSPPAGVPPPPPMPSTTSSQSLNITSLSKRLGRPLHYVDISNLVRQAAKVQTPFKLSHSRKKSESRQVKPAERWRFAIRTVIRMAQTIRLSMIANMKYKKISNAPGMNDHSLSYALKEFRSTGDAFRTSKIQEYLTREGRTEDDIATLNRLLLVGLPSFAKYNYNQRLRFCYFMEYEAHRKGATIIKQNHTPMFFYFILSGQVQVLKEKEHTDRNTRHGDDESELRIAFLNAGDSFGEVGMNYVSANGKYAPRSTSVVCTTPSEFLRVDIDDYVKIMKEENADSEYAMRVEMLTGLPLFSGADQSLIEEAASKAHIRHYEKDSVILEENESNRYLHFVVSGLCRIDKHLPFIKKKISKSQFTLRPWDPSAKLLKNEQKWIEIASLDDLEPGACFPEPLPTGLSIHDHLDRHSLINALNDFDALSRNRSFIRVVALRPVVCILLERIDAVRILSWAMLESFLESSGLYSIPILAMQEQFMVQMGWQEYKRRVLVKTIKEKSFVSIMGQPSEELVINMDCI